MTLRFHRRPFMMGNTPLSVLSRPYIRGQIRRDAATLTFPGLTLPAELVVEVDTGTFAVALTGLTLADIVADLNTALGAAGEARDEEGFLAVYTNAAGDGAFVRIQPGAGVVTDASYYLGLPRHPDPQATVESGDLGWAPPRPGLDNNPLSTTLVGTGEPYTAETTNRGMFALSRNTELLFQTVTTELARGMEIDVDPTDATWAARLVTDASGDVEQVDLSYLADRVYVGNGTLDRLSTLREIAKYFAVMRDDLVEMIVNGRTVRVAGVTHGQRVQPSPGFPDEVSPPAFPLPDVAVWTPPDGGNLLGLDATKSASAGIDEVINRTTVRCIGSTFQSDGVVAGDKATISGALGNDPFNHNGIYRVESVLDEEHLVLTAWTPGDRGELNPDGQPGNIVVTSGSLFADGVWLTFEPPVPANTDFKIVLGTATSLAEFPTDYLLSLSIRGFDEVDDLIQEVIRKMKGPLVDSTDDFTKDPFAHSIAGGATYAGEADVSMELLWRRITLQGAYDGQGRAAGGGFMVEVDDRPPRFQANNPRTARPGTTLRTGTDAQFLANNVFYAPGEAFTLDDVGRYLIVSGTVPGGMDPFASFKIIDYLDAEMVVTSEEEYAPGQIPVGVVSNYAVIEGRFEDWPAGMLTHTIEQGNLTGRHGYVYFEDMSPYSSYQPGHSFSGLRECPLHSGDGSILRYFDVTFDGSSWVGLLWDPTNSGNVRFGFDPVNAEFRPGGYIRITHSVDNSGWYEIRRADGAPNNRIQLRNLDGSTPALTAGSGKGHLYHATFTTNEPIGVDAIERIGHWFYEDGYASDDLAGVVGIGWRGDGSGLYGLINDSNLASVDRMPDATIGPISRFSVFSPAWGHELTYYGDWRPAQTNALIRGRWAMNLVGGTWAMDQNKANPLQRGFMAQVVQVGRDPGLVAISSQRIGAPGAGATSHYPSDFTDLVSIATIMGSNDLGMSQLQGGFLEFIGAVYQRDSNFWYPEGTIRGGMYSEMSGGFRNALYPMAVEGQIYHESTYRTRARLGWPGQMWPVDGTAYSVITLAPPDPSVSRALFSSGFATFEITDAHNGPQPPWDRIIGCQIELAGGDAKAAGVDEVYTIINVLSYLPSTAGYNLVLEVLRTGVTFPNYSGSMDGVILGSRWHYGYVDTASYMMFGTESYVDVGGTPTIRGPQQYPVLGVVEEHSLDWALNGDILNSVEPASYTFLDPEAAWPTYGHDTHAPLTPMTFIDQPYGSGGGDMRELVTGNHDAQSPPFVNNGYLSFYNSGVPRPIPSAVDYLPFYDEAYVSAGPAGHEQNFWNSEWVFLRGPDTHTIVGDVTAHNVPNSDTDAPVPGMELRLQSAPSINVSADAIRILGKGQRSLRTLSYELLVRAEMQTIVVGTPPATPLTVYCTLEADDGTVINTVSATINWGGAASVLSFNFPSALLRDAATRGFDEDTEFHVRFHFGAITTDDDGADLRIRFYRIDTSLPYANNLHHGNLLVEGALAAQGFRSLSPVRDYKVVGPADARLYVPGGYGDEVPFMPDGDYDTYDLPIEPPSKAVFIVNTDGPATHYGLADVKDMIEVNRGEDNMAIRFTNKWTDPKNYDYWLGGSPPPNGTTAGVLPPGRIGFSVPMHLPHGARLLEADVVMSFKPRLQTLGEQDRYFFDVYAQRELSVSSGGTNGTDIHGVRIRVFRHHLFRDVSEMTTRIGDTDDENAESFGPDLFIDGVHKPVLAGYTDSWDPTTTENQRFGFRELILRDYLVLPTSKDSVDAATQHTANEVGTLVIRNPGGGNPLAKGEEQIGYEFFSQRKLFCNTELGGGDPDAAVPDTYRHPDPSVFVADTRQYAYSMVIDAWGSGDLTVSGTFPPTGTVHRIDNAISNGMGAGVQWQLPPSTTVYPLDETAAQGNQDYYGPLRRTNVMKFRGLRFGYEWTRLSPG